MKRVETAYRVVYDGLEQLPTLDGFVQLLPPAWVPLDHDGVREETTSLSRQHLQHTFHQCVTFNDKVCIVNISGVFLGGV